MGIPTRKALLTCVCMCVCVEMQGLRLQGAGRVSAVIGLLQRWWRERKRERDREGEMRG